MTILLCDVGGTHIRFATAQDGAMTVPEKLRVDLHGSLQDAISRYLLAQQLPAGDVTHLYLAFSNRNNWSTEEAMLRTALPRAEMARVNDFEANALGISVSSDEDFDVLVTGSGQVTQGASRVVLGVGTGLGLAYVLDHNGSPLVQRTHGGHMLPAVSNDTQFKVFEALAALKQDKTCPIYEDVLSGRGLFSLYKFICHSNHLNAEYHDEADLLISGHDDPVVRETFQIWHEILGVFTHQAVAFGYGYGGVMLTGGVTDRIVRAGLFAREAFLRGFHQSAVPVVEKDVASTSVMWVRDEFVSLKGLLEYARRNGDDK